LAIYREVPSLRNRALYQAALVESRRAPATAQSYAARVAAAAADIAAGGPRTRAQAAAQQAVTRARTAEQQAVARARAQARNAAAQSRANLQLAQARNAAAQSRANLQLAQAQAAASRGVSATAARPGGMISKLAAGLLKGAAAITPAPYKAGLRPGSYGRLSGLGAVLAVM
jgi:histone H1/5